MPNNDDDDDDALHAIVIIVHFRVLLIFYSQYFVQMMVITVNTETRITANCYNAENHIQYPHFITSPRTAGRQC